ncbi:unnamed protein product [Rhizophagus irregularis]|nr:unnamed protein product [Rhizophagus irregularis]
MACSSFSSNQVVYQLDPPQCALFLIPLCLKLSMLLEGNSNGFRIGMYQSRKIFFTSRKQTISKRMKSRKGIDLRQVITDVRHLARNPRNVVTLITQKHAMSVRHAACMPNEILGLTITL